MERNFEESMIILDSSLSISCIQNNKSYNASCNSRDLRAYQNSSMMFQRNIDENWLTVEDAFQITKGNKRSQWIYGLTLCFIYSLPRNFVYALPFLGKYPDFEWRSDSHPDWYQCPRADVWNNSGELSGFEYRYNTNSIYTIDNWVTSMNLECVPEYKIGLFGSLYFIGYLLGSAFLTRFADINGRKSILTYSLATSTIAAILFLITNNLIMTYLLILINGFVIAPTASVSYLYMMEVIEEKSKKLFNYLTCTLDAWDIILISIYYYYIKSGESILYMYVIHAIINLATLYYIPESPHFLYSKCKFSELKDCFNNYAKLNNAPQLHPHAKFNKEGNWMNNIIEESSIWSLISDKSRLINLLVMIFNWCAWSFWFYFIGYFLKYFKGDMYTNTIMMGTADIIAVLLTRIGQNYFSTKKGFMLSFFVVFLVTLVYLSAESLSILAPLLILLIRLGTTIAFTLVYFGNSEIFPTIYLSTVFAICQIWAKSTTVFAPMVAEIIEKPIIIITILSLTAALMSTLLRPSKEMSKFISEPCKPSKSKLELSERSS